MASRIQKVKIQAETTGFQKATKQTNQLSQAQERSTRSIQNVGKLLPLQADNLLHRLLD